jgi:intracellular sulfur oxidation DsrE/DsrF family protein
MKSDTQISDEQINALIDNQLTEDERDSILALAQHDMVLARRIDVRRRIKNMLSTAYSRKSSASPSKLPEQNILNWQTLVASMLLFIVGGLLGMGGHMLFASKQAQRTIDDVALQQAAPNKMILQIDSNNPVRIRAALQDAELLLRQSKLQHQAVQLEVIANAAGLEMLRSTSPYRKQIARLAASYSNVHFLACGTGMAKFRRQGIELKLVPQARVVSAVTTQVAMRLQQGWSYLRE